QGNARLVAPKDQVWVTAMRCAKPQVDLLPVACLQTALVTPGVVKLLAAAILHVFRIEGDAGPVLRIDGDIPAGFRSLAARPQLDPLPTRLIFAVGVTGHVIERRVIFAQGE